MPSLPPDSALLVIDMQEDFCEPHGTLAVKNGRQIAPLIDSLLSLPFKITIASRDHHPANHCSFASQHPGEKPFTSSHTIHNPASTTPDPESQTTTLWPDHCVQGTPGCELIPELDATKIHHIVNKGEDIRVESYSAFGPPFREPEVGMSGLKGLLTDAKVERVYVCGLALDYCVKATALDAMRAGWQTYVVRDATEAVDQSDEAVGAVLEDFEEGGVKVIGSQVLLG
ncbi:hypothetical protein B0A48_00346 [Cryoendolithus antarcticus]|uniref:nicotinamidase n=1 Tax=Cryoendolithus antarcticus TaxID=1507870 RepID=A0A1V8TUH4_9PEZI|nr:hypothetical protein B0A48_00346 [Cryoendolithus antarcticus]